MSVSLPYLATPGSIKTALDRIRNAATPELVSGDFVTAKLQIKGSTGRAVAAYLKKIGFAGPDARPTEVYRRFRNPATSGSAVAEAVKLGYRDLSNVNEYFYSLSDKELLGLIVQITGGQADSSVTKLTLATLKYLIQFADFESTREDAPIPQIKFDDRERESFPANSSQSLGLNLSYTINLNLPATSDQTVFNAIFRSLKEHLLSNDR